MKKWIGSLMLAGMATVVMAQAPFTIVRPADGSRVRETVHVLVPKGSIPTDGYLGVFLGGKFLEATVPPVHGKYYDYALDTKKLGIPDTEPGKPLKLELVLYAQLENQSRIIGRTSVDVNIGNKANIPIPNDGVQLKYTFHTGEKLIYRLDQQVSTSSIGDKENSLGERAAEFTQDGESMRLLYEVMNTYPDGDGLLRMQALPDKGKDYAMITALGEQEQKKFMDYDMTPVYMRIHSNGKEVFGSLPGFVPIDGGGSGIETSSGASLFALYPLPTLPTRRENVGDDWQSQFQEGDANLLMGDAADVTSLVEEFPAKGQFVDTEWEMGHPCARIEHSIEEGTRTTSGKKLAAAGAEFGDDKISLKETIWFALDTHEVLKVIRDQTIDRKVANAPAGGGMGMGGPGGPPPGANAGGGFKGKGQGLSAAGAGFELPPLNINQAAGLAPGGGQGRLPGGRGVPGGIPGMGGMGQGRNGAPPSMGSTSTYVRIRTMVTFTLESRS